MIVSGCSAGDKTMDTRGLFGESGCSAGDTNIDTRGLWVAVAAVLSIHIWIHVASVLTVAAVLAIHKWIHVDRA